MANFDPRQYGAIPEEEFSPEALGAQAIELPKRNDKRNLLGPSVSQLVPQLEPFGKGVAQGAVQTFMPSAQFLSPQEAQSTPGELGSTIGQILPYIGGEAAGVGALARLAPKLAEKAIPSALAAIAPQAAVGALQDRQNPTIGALLGGAGGTAGHLLSKGIEKLPGALARLFPGRTATGASLGAPEYAAEQAAQSPELQAIGMPLGEETRSGRANVLYKMLEAVPFSGGREPYQKLSDILHQNKADILSSTGSNQDADKTFYNNLSEQYEKHVGNVNNAYKQVDELAKDKNISFKDDAYRDAYKNVISELNEKIKEKGGQGTWGPLKELMEKEYAPKKISSSLVDELGNPLVSKDSGIDSYEAARGAESNLNHSLLKMDSPDARKYKRYFTIMKNGLNKSMEDSATGKGKQINDAIKNANKLRVKQNEFENLNETTPTPFFDRYWNKKDTAGLISDYVKPSLYGKDMSTRLEDVLEKVPDDKKEVTRSIMAAQYLAPKTEGEELSLGDLHNKLKSLNSKQRELLFKDKKEDVDKFVDMLNRHPRAKSADYVPQTGLTGAKIMGTLGAVGAGGIGYGYGEHANNPLLQYGSIPLALLGARTGVRALRSKALKDAYLRSLQRLGSGPGPINQLLQRALSGAAPAGAVGLGNNLGGPRNGS